MVLPTGDVVTLIHFTHEMLLPPMEGDGLPLVQERIACMPNMTEFHATKHHPNYQRSNDTRAVTCPACKKSEVYREAKKSLDASTRG